VGLQRRCVRETSCPRLTLPAKSNGTSGPYLQEKEVRIMAAKKAAKKPAKKAAKKSSKKK
jgi:hypothetical protein